MSKELFVSSTPHETKVAVSEDDQLAEIYFERENEYTLAGSIYKGRVTRVLPGMQSAFVEIGLERDAFLYVSDFLLEEDEDVDVIDQGIPRPHAETRPAPRTEEHHGPIEAQDVMPVMPLLEQEADTGPEAGTETPASGSGEEGEREGARKWRGRRRRRGGRGQHSERGQHFDNQERENRPPSPAHEARTERPEPPPRQEASSEMRTIVLPGESISKYQSHGTPAPAKQTTALTPSVSRPRPSTEYSVQPAQISPDSFVLPGESLAKYQHAERTPAQRAAQSQVAVETRHEAVAAKPAQVVHGAQEHQEAHAVESVPPGDHHEAAEPPPIAAASVESHVEVVEEEFEPDLPRSLEEHNPETPRRAADVSSVVEHPVRSEPEVAADHSDAESRGAWYAPGAGVLEEEEITEDDESDMPEFIEHLDLSDDEELEEEVLNPQGEQLVPMGSELTEAVRDAHVNERATGAYEGEGLETEEDLHGEESDSEEDEREAAEGPEGPEGARAEHRAAAGTAGYQQRTERRGDRQRGGRPGRRMRGRPRQFVQRQQPAISDLLKEGQEILVQIAKEPIAKKGARITSHIALPGRYLVYMPTVHHTGVSRKIASDEERMRLKRIVLSERGESHGGFIVRTAASGANEDDLRADIRFLINLWNEIRGRAETSKAPSLLYHDLNLVERILRDQVTTSFSSIWVDTEQEYERIVRFVSRFQSSMVKRVKLYTKDTPLFEQFNITDEINKALKSKVWLKSGGYIVINQTEALVAIDINTGKFVGKTSRLEDTIVKTNMDAVKEIVRQVRLRDLGGIIVIDFIDMDERKNRQRVMQALEEALKADRAPSKVLQFNDFGLVAITRKRVKQSLERTLGQPCPTCSATGMIKSVSTVCNEIYVEMRKMSRHFERDVMLRVNPEVVKALKANNARWLQEMEELAGKTIIVKSDPVLHQEQFDIN